MYPEEVLYCAQVLGSDGEGTHKFTKPMPVGSLQRKYQRIVASDSDTGSKGNLAFLLHSGLSGC